MPVFKRRLRAAFFIQDEPPESRLQRNLAIRPENETISHILIVGRRVQDG